MTPSEAQSQISKLEREVLWLRNYVFSRTCTKVAIGKIASGTGDTYQMDLYENGYDQPSTQTVTVKQAFIAESETIPVDEPWMVVQTADGAWWMQFPVWV